MDKKVLYLLIIIVYLHLMFNSSLQLHYDEAYYWSWSKNLALSYYDHPPMIAYLIWFFTRFSQAEFFIRLTGVVCGVITILTIYNTTKLVYNQKAANISVILALAWPILEGTFFITTIDSPFLMFWALSIYCLLQAFVFNQTHYFYLAGISIGLMLLSKYTGVLILLGVLVYLILNRKLITYLLKPQIYLSLILIVAIFSPVLIWNYGHAWVSFKFQFAHGISERPQINWASLGDYIGSFIGANNPLITLSLLYGVFKWRKNIFRNPANLFLLSIFFSVVLFFLYNSLFKFMEANWVAPAFISGIIFLAGFLAESNLTWVYRLAIILVLILFPLIKMPEVFVPKAYQAKIPAINAFMGNRELYLQFKANYYQTGDVIFACDYGNASRAWYYLGVPVYVLANFKYAHSYLELDRNLKYPIGKALYFCDNNDHNYQSLLKQYFNQVTQMPTLGFRNSFVNNHLYVYQLSNASG